MKTMKAAQKTKPSPLYYQKQIDQYTRRRDWFFALAEAIEVIEPNAPEAARLRYRIDVDFQPRIMSAMRQYTVAWWMVDTAGPDARNVAYIELEQYFRRRDQRD